MDLKEKKKKITKVCTKGNKVPRKQSLRIIKVKTRVTDKVRVYDRECE